MSHLVGLPRALRLAVAGLDADGWRVGAYKVDACRGLRNRQVAHVRGGARDGVQHLVHAQEARVLRCAVARLTFQWITFFFLARHNTILH
eukprot:1184151-Prorocentrum_minimum.AAC.4